MSTRGGVSRLVVIVLCFFGAGAASAGSYWAVGVRTRAVESTNAAWVGPYAIVHPAAYDGSGGSVVVRVCVVQGNEALVAPLQEVSFSPNPEPIVS